MRRVKYCMEARRIERCHKREQMAGRRESETAKKGGEEGIGRQRGREKEGGRERERKKKSGSG